MSSALSNEVKAQRPAPPEWHRISERCSEAWQDVGNRERTVLEEAMDPNIPARDKILLRMRTEAEGDRRNTQYGCSAYTPCHVRFPQNWLQYHEYWRIAMRCLNTITALYVLDDRQRFPYIDATDMETWFWQQYRSFVQIFALEYETSSMKGSDIRSDGLISLHCDIWDSYTPGSQTMTTTLDIATKFILRLEQREVAAFGVQPNVCSLSPTSSYALEHREEAKKLGWVEERDGSLDDLSPRSSEWVDRTLFPKWLEKWQQPEQYTKDWWWNYQDLPESPELRLSKSGDCAKPNSSSSTSI
ncbi:hypothetical protein GGR58DRAFT_515836 [Xylaria digitata]|nr:hypothetical protein GGR58DRAFT_515836 [Xylaria digitata]